MKKRLLGFLALVLVLGSIAAAGPSTVIKPIRPGGGSSGITACGPYGC